MVVKSKSLVAHLSVLPDPRKTRGLRHKLLDIMVIAVLATICGEDDWEGVESFGLDHEEWLRTFLELPNAIPSHDTLQPGLPPPGSPRFPGDVPRLGQEVAGEDPRRCGGTRWEGASGVDGRRKEPFGHCERLVLAERHGPGAKWRSTRRAMR